MASYLPDIVAPIGSPLQDQINQLRREINDNFVLLGGSGPDFDNAVFTGTTTFPGNTFIGDNGYIGIDYIPGQVVNHPIVIGDASSSPSANPAIYIQRVIDTGNPTPTASPSAHAITDRTEYIINAGESAGAYTPFDAFHIISGDGPIGHSRGFQARMQLDNLFINNASSFYSELNGSGTVGSFHHAQIGVDTDFTGTITGVQTGLLIREMTKGATANRAIVTADNESIFGNLTITDTGLLVIPSGTAFDPAFPNTPTYAISFDPDLDTGIWRENGNGMTFTGRGLSRFTYFPGVASFDNPDLDPDGGDMMMSINAYLSGSTFPADREHNAILRFGAPRLSSVTPGTTQSGRGAIILPGNSTDNVAHFLLSAGTAGAPSGTFANILVTAQSLLEIHSSAIIKGWTSTAGVSRQYFELNDNGASWVRNDTSGAASFWAENQSAGTAAFASVEARNGSGDTTAVRLIASGTGFTPISYIPADAGVLVSGSALAGGLSINSLAGDIRLYGNSTLALTIAGATQIATFTAQVRAPSISTSATDFMHITTGALANGAAAQAGTLLNAPTAGNPAKWIAINDNGTTRYIPTWI